MLEVILTILLIIIGTLLFIGWLLYFITKKLGYPRLAKWLLSGYFGAILSYGLIVLLMDEFFTKNDARKLLAVTGVQLNEDFRVMENKSEWIGGYYHTFTLTISENDKNSILQSLRDSEEKAQNSISKTVSNDETDTSFTTMLKLYNKEQKEISYQIIISKTRNTLKYEEY